MYDVTLRHSTHPKVVSTLVKANESARVGIWCARCRGTEAAKATAISLLAGWWSLRGPKLTLAAVRTNLRGGEQSATTNAQMLRAIARHEYDCGNPEFAAMFANAAHATQPQRENSRLIDELNRGGYRAAVTKSPWRFAPYVPVVAFAAILGVFGLSALTGDDAESVAPVQLAASMVRPSDAAKPKKAQLDPNASAAELQKLLTSEYDRELALAYFTARLREARADIPLRVRQGDILAPIELSITELGIHPGVAPLLDQPGRRGAYENLTSVMRESTRYYNGGGSVEMLERTAGESLNVTADIAFAAIMSDMQGNNERTDALASEVDARAQSLLEMKRDLRIRAAVIGLTTKAIDGCIGSAR